MSINPYLAAAKALADTMYRGRRDVAGDRLTWDMLHDTDKAACLHLARTALDGSGLMDGQATA